MELEPAAAPRIDIAKLPYFTGFPYLTTRLASAVYHIRLLPAEWSRDAQWDLALRQAGTDPVRPHYRNSTTFLLSRTAPASILTK